MTARIPVTILTGFLGSGKTTLVRHILAHAEGRRIALVINEFGDLGVDADLIDGCDDAACDAGDIVELTNGCICCTVSEDFVPAMESILARTPPPDHIVVETSGLALPQPLIRAFTWPGLKTRLTVDGVVVLVDGRAVADGRFAHDPGAVDRQRRADESLDHESPLLELFEDQMVSADIIVLNKTDLLEPPTVAALARQMERDSRNGTRVVTASRARLPVEIVLGLRAEAELDTESRHERHHEHHDDDGDGTATHGEEDHGEFDSFVVELGAVDAPNVLVDRIAGAVSRHPILRVKGFAAVTGRPMRLAVQAAGPRVDHYFDRPFLPDEARISRLVVIGMGGLDRTAIEAELTGSSSVASC
ncbi:MAG: cobalamin biosynthesis protein CobW [Paracoccaceae bacterium]|nr:cobalamin biosynthesis protein CobW [Paracoccaceae bacterium]